MPTTDLQSGLRLLLDPAQTTTQHAARTDTVLDALGATEIRTLSEQMRIVADNCTRLSHTATAGRTQETDLRTRAARTLTAILAATTKPSLLQRLLGAHALTVSEAVTENAQELQTLATEVDDIAGRQSLIANHILAQNLTLTSQQHDLAEAMHVVRDLSNDPSIDQGVIAELVSRHAAMSEVSTVTLQQIDALQQIARPLAAAVDPLRDLAHTLTEIADNPDTITASQIHSALTSLSVNPSRSRKE